MTGHLDHGHDHGRRGPTPYDYGMPKVRQLAKMLPQGTATGAGRECVELLADAIEEIGRDLAERYEPVEREYTVLGVYAEPLGQRYAGTVYATSAEQAESRAQAEIADDAELLVAAVIEGQADPVDDDPIFYPEQQ